MTRESQPERMHLDALVEACMRESNKFFRDEANNDDYCFELFRRALKLKNNFAWEAIWQNYRNLVSGWIRKSGGFDQIDATIEELITLSFEKFWHATSTPAAFDGFTSLQGLLQYLRLCCASTVTDRLRRRKYEQHLADLDAAYYLAGGQKPESEVLNREQQQDFWATVQALLNDEQEKLLVRSYFVQGFKPRQIQQQYPHLFPDVQDVYRIKRNIMNRLRRNEGLRDFWSEYD